jgi:hypothetical protein
MSILVCKECKQSDDLSRNIAVTSAAWQRVEAKLVDGVIHEEVGPIEEMGLLGNTEVDYVEGYDCACGASAARLEDLVIQIDNDGEPIPEPIPGQEKLEI